MEDKERPVDQLRRLVSGEKDLYIRNDDDSILMTFLYSTEFDVEKAFEKVKSWYHMKAERSEWFAHRREEVHDNIIKMNNLMLLSDRDQRGRRIFLIKLNDMAGYDGYMEYQVHDVWLSLAFDEEETWKNGLVLLADLKTISWRSLKYLTPYNLRYSNKKYEKVPLKKIEVHYVNVGKIVNTLTAIASPFVSAEAKGKAYFHTTLASLHAHVHPSALPVEYGGHRESPDGAKLMRDYLDPRRQRLDELLSYGYRRNPKNEEDK